MLVICHLVWGTCSHSGRWALHVLLHIVLLKFSFARHTSIKLEKTPLFYNANDKITLGSKYITLHASRAHNYKPFPKHVSPHTYSRQIWFVSNEWRRKGCTERYLDSIFELWELDLAVIHFICLPHIRKALCWPLQKSYYCCCHNCKKYFNLWTYLQEKSYIW